MGRLVDGRDVLERHRLCGFTPMHLRQYRSTLANTLSREAVHLRKEDSHLYFILQSTWARHGT